MEDKGNKTTGKWWHAAGKMPAGTVAGIVEKYRRMIGTARLSTVRDSIVRMISLRKIKGLPERMAMLSEELRSSAGNESHFLDMGRTLQSVYTDTTELVRHIQDAIQEVMGDADDNILNKAGGLAKQAERALNHRQERVASSLIQIKDVADHLGGLHQACDHLGRIAMNLRVVGLNIGVESTRSAEGREMFTVVSKEILELSVKVDAIVNRIREDATAAMTEQMQAFKTISGGLQELNDLTAKASGVTSAAANETEKGITAFLKTFETADARFREISSRVGEIVMGIQFHDSMRQRVEHITDALDDSGRTLRGRSSDRAAEDSKTAGHAASLGGLQKEELANALSVVTLQKIQLADVVSEIYRVYQESTTAFEEIGHEIGELDTIMSTVNADIHVPHSGNRGTLSDPFSKLADALTGLNELLGRGDELGSQIDESVSRASEIGRRFSVHLGDVDAISFETKIKALNAIVKAGHMSEEGRTLEVLAQEMNRLSEQTNDFVAGVEEKLRRVGEFGDRIQNLGKSGREENGQYAPEISEIISGGIEEISRMRDLMNARAEKAMEKVEALRAVVSRTLSDLNFLTALADDMSGHLETLEAIDSRLSLLVGKWKIGEVSDADTLSKSYTMQRERMLHATVFSSKNELTGKTGARHVNPRPLEIEGEISLWGDDDGETDGTLDGEGEVTLWGDDGGEEESDRPGKRDVSLWGDDGGEAESDRSGKRDVSLWGDDGGEAESDRPGKRDVSLRGGEGDETGSSPPEKAGDNEEFGDNIELF